MKLTSIITDVKNFINAQVNLIKSDNQKEQQELLKIERKIRTLELKERKTQNGVTWSKKTMFTFWFMGLIIVFLGYLTYQSLDILYLILTALIISIAMEAVIDFFQRRIPRSISILISYFLLILLLLLGFIFIIPFLLGQFSDLINIGITTIKNFQELLVNKSLVGIIQDITWLPKYIKTSVLASINDPIMLQSIQSRLNENISQIIGTGTEYAKNIFDFSVNFITGFLNFLTRTGIVTTLAVLFSIEKNAVVGFMAKLGGSSNTDYVQIKIYKLYKKLGLWLKGQLILCFFIGVTILLALVIMRLFGLVIPQVGSLALIAGLTELIPYVGPILGTIPAVLIVLMYNGIYGALIMIAVVFLVQRLENNVLIPVVMNKTLGVNPITIFISMIIGGIIMGFVGILLAVPISVIITMIIDDKFE